jgi:hypothetical protein
LHEIGNLETQKERKQQGGRRNGCYENLAKVESLENWVKLRSSKSGRIRKELTCLPFMMGSMKLGSKPEAFQRRGQAWFCTSGLARVASISK